MTEIPTKAMFAELAAKKLEAQRAACAEFRNMEAQIELAVALHLRANNGEMPHQPFIDPRRVAMARTHFEEGFRALYIGLGARIHPPE